MNHVLDVVLKAASGHWTEIVMAFLALSGWATAFMERRSAGIARRELALSERAELARNPRWALTLERATLERVDGSDRITFLVRVVNQSDASNTLTRCDLRVDYLLDGGAMACFVGAGEPPGQEGNSLPLMVEARGAALQPIHFSMPSEVLKDRFVKRYVLVFTDSHDEEMTLTSVLPSEVISRD